MNSESFINSFIKAANDFNTTSFIKHWHKDAVLNDPSVGSTFKGHDEIQKYFEDYFIGYRTQTRLIKSGTSKTNKIHIEVLFTGTFPQGEIGGTFDFVLKDNKIIAATADLIH